MSTLTLPRPEASRECRRVATPDRDKRTRFHADLALSSPAHGHLKVSLLLGDAQMVPHMRKADVFTTLRSVQGIGRRRANAILRAAGIEPITRFEDLSADQRLALRRLLRERARRARRTPLVGPAHTFTAEERARGPRSRALRGTALREIASQPDLASGAALAREMLLNEDPRLREVEVERFLGAIPRVGPRRTGEILLYASAERVRLKAMRPWQIARIAAALAEMAHLDVAAAA